MRYDALTVPTPAGPLTVVAHEGVAMACGFTADAGSLCGRLADPVADLRVVADLGQISRALHAYLSGEDVTAIDELPVSAEGSPTMLRLWAELRRIPAGEVRSYAELGGSRRHARVAGAACARNPIALIVPCHRVVRADGTLGGFGWGLAVKRWLLDHEAAAVGPAAQPALVVAG
jgi:methylated-DNA-[protein]-cysteine S-methyltransferase